MIQRFADAIYAQQLAMLGLLLSWISLAGCSELLPVLVPYGSVSSPDQYRSINGLGIHRRMWESTGAKVLTPSKLSPKLESVDVIVLVGQTYNPPGKTARRWLEDWLAAGNGRTVIYFGRDFNADVYYREQTLAQVPIEEQPRAEQLRALAVASDLGERIREIPESTFCDWFFIDVDQTTQYFKKFGGDWGEEVDGLSGSWPTRALLQPPLPSFQTRTPSWLAAQPGKATTPSPESPIGNSGIRRSIWKPTEFDNQQAWDEAFQALPHIDNLLASSDGQPLVFRFSDPIKFPRSQIIIVTNGAPLLNGSLTEPLHQRIGELLIEEALPAERVALLAFDTNGLLISDVPEADPRGAGLEMLLLWPLSGITMCGVWVCPCERVRHYPSADTACATRTAGGTANTTCKGVMGAHGMPAAWW